MPKKPQRGSLVRGPKRPPSVEKGVVSRAVLPDWRTRLQTAPRTFTDMIDDQQEYCSKPISHAGVAVGDKHVSDTVLTLKGREVDSYNEFYQHIETCGSGDSEKLFPTTTASYQWLILQDWPFDSDPTEKLFDWISTIMCGLYSYIINQCVSVMFVHYPKTQLLASKSGT